MGSMTQGVTAGIAAYQRGKHLELLRENQERQAMLGGIETLNKILGMPKNLRGPMLDQYGEDIARMTGKRISATLIDTFKKADEEQAGTLREVFSQAGLEMDPQKMMGLMGDPYKALDFAMKVQKGKQATATQAKRASIMGGGQAAEAQPAPDPGAPPQPPGQAAPQPMAAPPVQAPAAAPAQDDDQAEVARLNSVEDQTLGQIDKLMQMGEGISEGEKRGFDAKLHALEKRRTAIMNAPGITETVAGPGGEALRVLFSKNGRIKEVLGPLPKNLELTTGVHPKTGDDVRIAFDKNTGKETILGPAPMKAGGTLAERVAAAERIATENPNDPRAQANLAQANRAQAIQEQMRAAEVEATARGTKKAALETPERPNQSVIKEFAEYDSSIASVANLMKAVADPEIQQVLGMSPEAFARRKSTKATAKFVTTKQIDYMAELANTTGELRRVLVGQAQTNPEMKNLLPLLPKDSDPVKIQHGKLQAIARGIERIRGKHAEGLESVNIMVPGEAGRGGRGRGTAPMSAEDMRALAAEKANAGTAGEKMGKAVDAFTSTLDEWLYPKKKK